jgi:phosphatidylinositol-4,5-bisphosphate 3-kinase
LGEQIASKRSAMTLKEKILYQYPPKLAKTSEIPVQVKSVLRENSEFQIVAKLPNENISTITLQVSCFLNPSQLLEQIILKKQSKLKNFRGKTQEYILKICGQEEYIFGDYPLVQFLYIQDRLSRGETPIVVVTFVSDVYVFTSNYVPHEQIIQQNQTKIDVRTLPRKHRDKHLSTWEIDESFTFTIQALNNLTLDANKTMEIGIQAGLFHGGKSLCEKQCSSECRMIGNDNNKASVEFDETLKFDIKVSNIPRMTRLCLVIYEVVKNIKHARTRRLKHAQKDLCIQPLCWINTTLFDYKNQFKSGGQTLYSWTYSEDSDSDELLHPLGTVEPNPRIAECASVTLTYQNYQSDTTVSYPSKIDILEYAAKRPQPPDLREEEARTIINILQPYLYNDRISDISEQERKDIWDRRNDCRKFIPDGLPCLLYCVEWNNRGQVSEAVALLEDWPQDKMSVERTLELLDYAYADSYVRSFAVKCLEKIKDEDLQLYLLQLVQAIKHESYLSCDLVEFLLQRALKNQRIGHFLFWHLRSEIQVPSVEVRFSLILEAYLRSSKEHISILMRQILW